MKFIKTTQQGHILEIELSRADVRNAFNPEMIQEITSAFSQVKISDVRAVILTGAGSVFCAGADLNWMQSMVNYSLPENIADSEKLYDMFEAIRKCPVPVICAVQGAAYGGALGLIAASDIVVVEEKAQLCFSEVKLGLAPAVISEFVLSKVSPAKAGLYMLTAKVFGAKEALDMGLAHYVCNTDLKQQAVQLASEFLKLGPEAVAATKQLVANLPKMEANKRKSYVCEKIANLRAGAEGQEGIRSFLEKRAAQWQITAD